MISDKEVDKLYKKIMNKELFEFLLKKSEQLKHTQKSHYIRNREKLIESAKERQKKRTPEEIAVYNKRYYDKNKKKIQAKQREYYKKHAKS